MVKAFLPRLYITYGLAPFELRGRPYYFIEATSLTLMKYDLIRLRWLEKLKIVHMYLFLLNPNTENFIRRGGEYVLQNRWAYDQVASVVPADRIAVMGRACQSVIFGLPDLPSVYNTLDVAADPPVFQPKAWGDFHEDLQAELFSFVNGD